MCVMKAHGYDAVTLHTVEEDLIIVKFVFTG